MKLIDQIVERMKPEDILTLRVSDEEDERLQYLMERNNEGELTDSERDELNYFAEMDRLVSLLKAKALVVLKNQPS
jgi:hypothetical protein